MPLRVSKRRSFAFSQVGRPLTHRSSDLFHEASPFVRDCLSTIAHPVSEWALDLPCGYGRHARVLAMLGYQVLCADIAFNCVGRLREQSLLSNAALFPIQADAQSRLPVADASMGLVVITDFVALGLLERAAALLMPGGYLVYETFSLRGQNWRELPRRGAVKGAVDGKVEMIGYRETPGGPSNESRAKVQMLARRQHAIGTNV